MWAFHWKQPIKDVKYWPFEKLKTIELEICWNEDEKGGK